MTFEPEMPWSNSIVNSIEYLESILSYTGSLMESTNNFSVLLLIQAQMAVEIDIHMPYSGRLSLPCVS